MAAPAALQRRASHGPGTDLDRAARARSPRLAGADGVECLAWRGAYRRYGRADPVAGSEPHALGPVPDPPRIAGARAGARPWRRARLLRPAGGHRCPPRPGP